MVCSGHQRRIYATNTMNCAIVVGHQMHLPSSELYERTASARKRPRMVAAEEKTNCEDEFHSSIKASGQTHADELQRYQHAV